MSPAASAQRSRCGRLCERFRLRKPVGQVDPVPGLFDLVVGQPALQLAFEDAAGVVGAELGQGADLDDVLHAGPQAGLDGLDLAALEQVAEAGLGRFDGGLAELAALEQVDVLPADRRQFVAWVLAPMQVPAEQEGRRHQHRQQHGQQEYRVRQFHVRARRFAPRTLKFRAPGRRRRRHTCSWSILCKPHGPRAWNLSVLMPISAPRPNS